MPAPARARHSTTSSNYTPDRVPHPRFAPQLPDQQELRAETVRDFALSKPEIRSLEQIADPNPSA